MHRHIVAALATTALLVPAAFLGVAALPAHADNTKGDTWVTNTEVTPAGHDQVPHLDCTTIYLHGSALDAGGGYTIASIPGTGSGMQVWSGTWATPVTGDVIATLDGSALVAAAIAQDHAVPNINQGYHFKLTVAQDSGDKYKVFWVKCGEAPTPGLTIHKTADAASVVAGADIGFTVTIGVPQDGFANGVTLSDPLPTGVDLNWSLSPSWSGCAIAGTAPALQTLNCSLGDMGDTTTTVSVHVVSHTTAATAPTTAVTVTNTATAQATGVEPLHASAAVTITPPAPQSPSLGITKTADAVTATAGSGVGFTISVHNAGPGMATAAVINDPLPGATGVSWVLSPAYTGQGSCAITGSAPSQTLVCSLGDLASGGTVSVHVSSTTDAATAVSLVNTATSSAANNPAVTATATEATVVPPAPQSPSLGITKTADAVTATAGSGVGFTISVHNAGPGMATAAVINDPLPGATGVSWVLSPAYTGQGSCAITGSAPSQTLVCSLGDLASGGTVSVHVSSTTDAATAVSLVNTATASAANNPAVTATAQVQVQVAAVLATTTTTTPTTTTPSTTTPTTTTTTPTTTVLGEQITRLPNTGTNVLRLLVPALLLLLAGGVLEAMSRRRAAVTSR